MIAVLSDVHGNLEALQAVLEDAAREGASRVVSLGDVVGYGANPNECVERVAKEASTMVLGNHDQAAIDESASEHFNAVARRAIEWTRQELTPENIQRLRETAVEAVEDGQRYVHASPDDPLSWNYVLTHSDALAAFECFSERICWIGHSHVPARLLLRGGELKILHDVEFKIPEDGRALVNVGSVGQPRDGDWMASYALFDASTQRVIARRVSYDREAAASKILAAGLPEILARRLALGR